MKTIALLLLVAASAQAELPQSTLPLERLPQSTLEVAWNLRALTEQPKPIPAPARLPNIGSCVCNRTGGQCFCQPASDCAKGKCPALQQLRKDEIPYYFPTFDPNCPTGK